MRAVPWRSRHREPPLGGAAVQRAGIVFKAWKNKGGRPPVEQPKVHIGFRLAADVVKGVRATGPGYNARVEKVLREALANGQL